LVALLDEHDVFTRALVAVAAPGDLDLVDLLGVVLGDLEFGEVRGESLDAVSRGVRGLFLTLERDGSAERCEHDDREDEFLFRSQGPPRWGRRGRPYLARAPRRSLDTILVLLSLPASPPEEPEEGEEERNARRERPLDVRPDLAAGGLVLFVLLPLCDFVVLR